MKKLVLVLPVLFLMTNSYAQLGETIGVGGGALTGGALLGGISSAIMSGQTNKKVADQKDKIGCYVNNKKLAGWEGNLILPKIDVDAQRSTILYKNSTGNETGLRSFTRDR